MRDGTLIVSCAGDGLIRVWDTGTGQCLRTLVHEDNAPVVGVRFSPNGRFVLAWTLDACVRLWNYVDGRCVKTYQGHVNGRFSLGGAFGVYGGEEQGVETKACVVSGSEDGRVVWWDVVSKELRGEVEGHEGAVLGVDSREEGRVVVSCGIDRTVRVWERLEDDAEHAAGGGGMAENDGEERGHELVNGSGEGYPHENGTDGGGAVHVNGHMEVDG